MLLRTLLVVGLLLPIVARAADTRCQGRPTSIYVSTEQHELLLCQKGSVAGTYSVALGRGGVDKRKQGDLKTPLGTYSLSLPQVSKKFGLFVPVGYPTAEQRRAGFTGSAVGIHGPSRKLAWARRLNTLVDWTQGCIAVSSDDAMKEVAAWVKRHRPKQIVIAQ